MSPVPSYADALNRACSPKVPSKFAAPASATSAEGPSETQRCIQYLSNGLEDLANAISRLRGALGPVLVSENESPVQTRDVEKNSSAPLITSLVDLRIRLNNEVDRLNYLAHNLVL